MNERYTISITRDDGSAQNWYVDNPSKIEVTIVTRIKWEPGKMFVKADP